MSRLSIRTKLPLAIGAVVVIVGASIAAAGWLVIRRTSYDRAEDRLASLAASLSRTLNGSIAGVQARTAALARRPEFAAFLRGPDPKTEAAVYQVLRSSGSASSSVRTEIRDRDGRVLLAEPQENEDPGAAFQPVAWQTIAGRLRAAREETPPRPAVHGRLHHHAGDVVYPVVASIPGQAGAFLVDWRRLSGTAQAREQVSGLLGSEAALLIGNDDGSVWSDFGVPVTSELPDIAPNMVHRLSRPGRGDVLAAVEALDNAPWKVAVEFTRRDIEAPIRTFFNAVGLIALVTTGAGVLLGWMLGRRIVAPVQALTDATEAIAAGDASRRVPPLGEDEFGRLGASFNTMADEIQRSRDTLEEQVSERTRELREARESLARREKLTLIAHLAGGVGHEIRNPLGVMSNAIYYLEAVQKDAPKDVRDYLALLRQQVNITAKIVNDLLDMSRTTPAHRQDVSVQELVAPLVSQMNGVAVQVDLPPDLPKVTVDPVHAGQVLQNLLENASQAMGGSGTIQIRARNRGDRHVEIEVRDSGPGIREEHIDKVFEPLFTTKARGIGLGLAVSKSLAQANDGDLALVSGPGEGACFALTLPVAGSTT